MSMLTAQCDKLRSWAKQFEERADLDALAPLLASDLREAADTIEGLRERLQDEVLRGECYNAAPDYLDFLCSSCGFVHYHSDENDSGDGNEWNYCPRCGKAVKR